jgi:hypothetical protein
MTSIVNDFGAIAAGMRGATAVAHSADVELVNACAALDRLTWLERSVHHGGANYIEDDDQRLLYLESFEDEQEALRDQIANTPALTNEGIRAKARSLAMWAPDLLGDPGGDRAEILVTSILKDLTGWRSEDEADAALQKLRP